MNNMVYNIDKNIDELYKKKYRLKEEQRKVTILSKPNVTPVKFTKEDIDKIRSKKLGNELIKFRKKLYKKLNNQNLTLLNNNIASLKVKIKYLDPKIFSLKVSAGTYSVKKNKIKLLSFLKNGVINHELIHMATAFYDKKYKIGFCGFQQILFYNGESLGCGLNEGYTQLISKRYFNENNDYTTDGYKICMFFAEKVEEIVGKDRMESFYFNADLMGLYKYLTKFDESSNIYTFIINLDNIIKKEDISNVKNDPEYGLLSCYLSKWFIKFKQEELSKNTIDKGTFDKQIYDYLCALGTLELYLENQKNKKNTV